MFSRLGRTQIDDLFDMFRFPKHVLTSMLGKSASRNKCHATSNRCHATRNKKLLKTSEKKHPVVTVQHDGHSGSPNEKSFRRYWPGPMLPPLRHPRSKRHARRGHVARSRARGFCWVLFFHKQSNGRLSGVDSMPVLHLCSRKRSAQPKDLFSLDLAMGPSEMNTW